MTKEHTPHPSSWMGYISQVKEVVNRELTENEYKISMFGYIHSVTVEEVAKKLEEK